MGFQTVKLQRIRNQKGFRILTTVKARKQEIKLVLKGKNFKHRILYPGKLLSKYDFRSLFRHVSSPKFISHAFFPKNLQEDVLQQKAGINQERKQYWEIIWEIRIPTEGRAEGIPRVTAVQLCWSRSEQSRSYFFRKITLIAKQTQLSTLSERRGKYLVQSLALD